MGGLFDDSGRDSISESFVKALGWEGYRRGLSEYWEQNRFDIPPCTLPELARQIQQRLMIPEHAIRIAGDLQTTFSRVCISLGAPGDLLLTEYQSGDVDVCIAGETSEWQFPEYVRDACELGLSKGLVLLGHCNSEEHGMAQL